MPWGCLGVVAAPAGMAAACVAVFLQLTNRAFTLPCPPTPHQSPPAVDSSKRPVDIPFELEPQGQAEQLRWRLAVQKRSERLALRDKMRARKKIRMSLDGRERCAGGWMRGGNQGLQSAGCWWQGAPGDATGHALTAPACPPVPPPSRLQRGVVRL